MEIGAIGGDADYADRPELAEYASLFRPTAL